MTMAAIWFDSRHPPPACGNCGRKLKLAVVREAIVFSAASEIPGEIKDGSVNLAICPRCSYHAWVWSGLLVVDRGARRAVFCVVNLDEPGLEELLEERWTRLAAVLPADEQAPIR